MAPVYRGTGRAINGEMKDWDLRLQRSRCVGVTVPVLVVTGDAEPRPPRALDSLVSALGDVTRTTVTGAGHWPWLEQGQATGRILDGFLIQDPRPGVNRIEAAGGEVPTRS